MVLYLLPHRRSAYHTRGLTPKHASFQDAAWNLDLGAPSTEDSMATRKQYRINELGEANFAFE